MDIEDAKIYTPKDILKRWFPSLIILLLSIYFLVNRGEFTFLDMYHLIVHEAGHFILGFFGNFIMMTGGTIMQLLIPALLILYFFQSRMRVLFQLGLFLEGHSFINVSVYAGDAQAMKLRLFGPPGAKHDWNTILTQLDILEYTPTVALFFLLLAGACFILAALTPLFFPDQS